MEHEVFSEVAGLILLFVVFGFFILFVCISSNAQAEAERAATSDELANLSNEVKTVLRCNCDYPITIGDIRRAESEVAVARALKEVSEKQQQALSLRT